MLPRLTVIFDRFRVALKRPVSWGAVMLSYVGICAALVFTYTTDEVNDRDRVARAGESRDAIVQTGQTAIGSACEFDNTRTQELRVSLRLFLEDHHQLHDQVNELRALEDLPPDPLDETNISAIRRGIRHISVRDCDAASSVLTDNPARQKEKRK